VGNEQDELCIEISTISMELWDFRPWSFEVIRRVYIGEGDTIMPATTTGNSDTLAFALATLGKPTEIEMIIIAEASKVVDIALQYPGRFHAQTSPM